MGFVWLKYTWLYQRADRVHIRERLGRALVTSDWLLKFPSAKLYHLSSSLRSLSSFVIYVGDTKKKKKGSGRIWRLESMWLKDSRCERVVSEA